MLCWCVMLLCYVLCCVLSHVHMSGIVVLCVMLLCYVLCCVLSHVNCQAFVFGRRTFWHSVHNFFKSLYSCGIGLRSNISLQTTPFNKGRPKTTKRRGGRTQRSILRQASQVGMVIKKDHHNTNITTNRLPKQSESTSLSH